jgi:D-serine deaminase-like pyridoxal phosphate-dependent protein
MTAPLSLDSLQTPALLVDLDRVRANVARTIELVGGADRWQPHIKTAKLPAVLDLLLEAGVRHFKCATTREAAVLLARAEATEASIELLLAMAVHGPNLARLAALAEAHPNHRVSVLSEDRTHATHVRETFPRLGLYVDLDPGFGRTGIPLAEEARIRAVVAAAGDRVRGLHAYEGQFAAIALPERPAAADTIHRRLVTLADGLGLGERDMITSGTPAFPFAAGHPAYAGRRHRVSPGTVVYWDLNSETTALAGYGCAATVLTTVISRPAADRVTLDAGSKAVDAAAGDPCAVVEGWPGLVAQRPSEEHLPLAVVTGDAPPRGARLRLWPRHVCPTINLADEAALIEDGAVVGVATVAARGHELLGEG